AETMQYEPKEYNILLSPSRNLFAQTLTLMCSVIQSCDRYTNFYIMTSDWSDDLKQTCRSFAEKYSHTHVCFIDVRDEMFHSFIPWRGYYQCYYMFEAAGLLPGNVDRILYLDIDTIVLGDISLLYSDDFDGCYFMAAEENCKRKCSDFASFDKKHKQPALFNSGVLMMNIPELRACKIDKDFFLDQVKNMPDENYFADQGLLNYCFWDKTKYVPAYNWNHTTYQEQSFNEMLTCGESERVLFNEAYSEQKYDIRETGIKIVHFTVSDKPWNVYLNPSGEAFGKLVPAEVKPLIIQYYRAWWSFAREIPLEFYEQLLINAFEKERVNREKRCSDLKNALNFTNLLAEDLSGENRFIHNIAAIKERGLRLAIFKSNDIAGKLLRKILKNHGVDMVFSTPGNNIDKLTTEEIDLCRSADLIIGADVHKRSSPAFYNKKSINICNLLESANAVEILYKK
ncbi:MAG: hypothetical protein K2J80_13410, partial [Oscillospiraceae bacterium]|nr:hypothetical protein [Oscillospiraceae bacterium]